MSLITDLSTNAQRIDRAIGDLFLRQGSEGQHEATVLIPTERNNTAMRARIDEIRRDLAGLDAEEVAAPLRDLFNDALSGLEASLAGDLARPESHVRRHASYLQRTVTQDPRTPEERRPLVAARLAALPDLFAAVYELCGVRPDDRLEAVNESLDSLGGILGVCRETLAGWPDGASLVAACDQAAGAARQLHGDIAGLLGQPRELASEMSYADLLAGRFGVPIAELLAWHEEAIAEAEEALTQAAAAVEPGVPAHLLLDRRSGPYDSPEAMFAAAHECLELARARSRDFIDLPEGERCNINPLPQILESSFPWGAAGSFPAVRGLLPGNWYLNRSNWRAVTRGWVQMMAIHEVYPGHYAHAAKTASGDLPLTLKTLGFSGRGTPVTEGIAHRSEELLIDLYDDPLFPVFVRLRRLHTATRIKADLMLHHQGRPIEEAVQLYVDKLGFSRESARGQVRYQELHPGYMVCYFYGYRALTGLRASSRLSEKAFTDTTFASGYPTLALVAALLQEKEEAGRSA